MPFLVGAEVGLAGCSELYFATSACAPWSVLYMNSAPMVPQWVSRNNIEQLAQRHAVFAKVGVAGIEYHLLGRRLKTVKRRV